MGAALSRVVGVIGVGVRYRLRGVGVGDLTGIDAGVVDAVAVAVERKRLV